MIYKNKKNQRYEEYWKFTAAKTDFKNKLFIEGLKIIVDRIDQKDAYIYKDNKVPSSYQKLQESLVKLNGWDSKDTCANARKEINTWVKLGFLSSGLKNYHPRTRQFLEASSDFERNTILAKIFLDGNQFEASVANNDPGKTNRVKFLMRTLEHNKKLTKDDLFGIMLTNPDEYDQGFLNENQLKERNTYAKEIGFKKRKYNQIGHLKSILKFLNQYIVFINGELHHRDDDDEIQQLSKPKGKPIRSQTEQQNFRDLLIVESNRILGESEDNTRCRCMLSNRPTSKSRIRASHIWAYRMCDEDAEYDPNNGLLLAEDTDYYFDNGIISFSDDGTVLMKNDLDIEWKKIFKEMKLNKKFLNTGRKDFLKTHRKIYGF